MALTGDQIEAVTASTVGLYQEVEQAILAEITRRLAAGMDAPDWAVTRLGALSTLRTATERILGLVQAAGADQIRQTLAAAYRSGQAIATTGLPAQLLRGDPDSGRLAAVIQQVPRVAAVESLAAALVADIGAKHSNVLRTVLDAYRSVIQQASAVSIAGGMTRRQASQHAYAKLVDQGLTSFVDSSGRRWRLSSYVEMATRTVTQRAAVQGQTDRLTTLGVDTVIVSDSPRECPKCRPWEGKILSISGGQRGRVELPSAVGSGTVTVDIAGSVADARAAGLQHPNCTHSLRAFLPGATRRPARPTENPEGYRAKERQREIERQIRKWKERETAALDPAAAAGARAKVRAWQGEMRNHLTANPELKRLSYREQPGAGNIPGPRAGGPGVSPPRPLAGGPGSPIQAADLTPPAPPTPAPPALPQRTRSAPTPPTESLTDILAVDLDRAANRDLVRDRMASVIDGRYAGLGVEVTDVTGYEGFGAAGRGHGLIVSARIVDQGGEPSGRVQRAFYRDGDDLVAVHAFLQIDRDLRGKGFASEFNANLERWYRSQGIVRIEVHANIDVGGYTWASHGYDFADDYAAQSVINRLRFMVGVVQSRSAELRERAAAASAEDARRLRATADALDRQLLATGDILDRAATEPFGSDRYPSAWEISQLGRSEAAGGEWIGKMTMLGSDWQGVKWL
ncbi:minor capsid protein [Solwaraspora sp. WMMD1047]|uniref:phage minor capsid protein n=1 Tax=Solwaraspora sp. WMMD1047 TaxID=3016102 RepID=UPI0024166037|nr:phage minor capsid protein [Solwaraspora sp. WMMD1047]MDG4832418.1 minor capsid protein [Solwaraspora sp. WMMD1047]